MAGLPLFTALRKSGSRLFLVAGTLVAATCDRGVDSVALERVDFQTTEGTNLAFDLSPDGQQIVFDLLGQLWLLPVEGGTAVPITDAVRDTADDRGPTFSSDGRWIAFHADRPGGTGLFRIAIDGGRPQRLTIANPDRFGSSNPAWGPSSKIAYARQDTLYLVDAELGGVTPIPIDLPGSSQQPAGDARFVPRVGVGAPSWFPDGTRIAFNTGSGGEFRVGVGAASKMYEVAVDGGQATPLGDGSQPALAPAYSPDGTRVAYFARQSDATVGASTWQVWVRPLVGGEPRRLTNQEGMAVRRVVWTPDGGSLIYSAAGRLWRVPAIGGQAKEIPFTARVSFDRKVTHLPPVRFPDPGSEQPARGFAGLALSQDGSRVAMLALDHLWVWDVADGTGSDEALIRVPPGASSPTWSADGTEVVYSSGDLYAVSVATGQIRQVTALPGDEEFPAWSPDGRLLAFVHGRTCRFGNCSPGRIRVVGADQPLVRDTAAVATIGETPARLSHGLVWSPDSDAVLAYNAFPRFGATLARVDGPSKRLSEFPPGYTFIGWPNGDSLVYIRGNQLWTAVFDTVTGRIHGAAPILDDPAQEPSVTPTGSILYLSGDGLRLRAPDGTVRSLGWPVTYRVPPAPPPLLIRGGNVIDGTGSPAVARDLRIEGGRIVALAPAGTLIGEVGDSILDASGRTVLPGFIDAHKHIFEPDSPELLGVLYFGTTTIRDAGSSLAPAAGLRDRILSGARPGPRIVYAGPMFYGEELPELMGLTDQFNQFIAEAEEISRGLAIAKGMGAEFVKHYGYSNWSEMVRTIEEAHRMGLRISGHCTSVLPAVAAGADGHEHGAQCSRNLARVRQDYARLDVAAGMWATVSPALMLVDLLEHDDPQYRERPPLRSFVRGTSIAYRSPREAWLSRYLRWRSLTTTLYEEGVLLASGTDHYMPNATQINLQGLVEAGLTPLEAIAAVTSQAARVVGAEQDLGTVQIGKIADLVVLDADPTTDIRNAGLVWQVIQGGRIVDRESLVEQAEEESSGNN